MLITVAICTFNRSDVLAETLMSLWACRSASIDWEVLIIDNKSTDQTSATAHNFCTKHPGFRYFLEPVQGLSHARNTAIAHANGDVIAFVDDDVYFDEAWLINLHRYFNSELVVDCLGGRVVPHLEAARPAWLEDQMMWIYGATRYGDQAKLIVPPDIPIGCNMAFRSSVFTAIGSFDVALGRIGKSLLSNEESELFARMALAGMKTWYAPDVSVRHRIPDGRLQKEWVKSRYFWQGVSDVALRAVSGSRPDLWTFLGITWSAFRRLWRITWHGKKAPGTLYLRMANFSYQLQCQYEWGVGWEALRHCLRNRRIKPAEILRKKS